ncbi:MAG TPA: PAS domain S-box protein [Gaiellaceae bacterium]
MDETRPGFVLGDEFARILAETTRSLVCVLDCDGRILLFNDACELATGFSREEVVGRDARESVIPREEAEAFGEVLAFIWRTGHSSPQVGHWQAKDGSRRLIAWSNRLMSGEDGGPRYLVTAGIDLTEQARAREEERALEGDPGAKLLEVGQLAQEQRALRRVATLVASEATPEAVFMAVSTEAARVLGVTSSAVFRYEGDDTATVVGRHYRDDIGAFELGERFEATESTTIGRVLRTRATARIDDYSKLSGEVPELMMRIGYLSTVAAPITVAGTLWGAVAVASVEPLPPGSETRLGGFAELVSLAVASAQARDDLRSSRARIVKTGDEQRRKLERNLHDGAQQRLVSLSLQLRVARAQLASAPDEAAATLAKAAEELDQALKELRELARGLHPGTLTEHGLLNALKALGDRLPVEVELDVADERYPRDVEATAYYLCAEALTNVAKHARATKATVRLWQDGGLLRFEVADDGRGGADPMGSGVLGLRDRAEAAGGTLFVISPPGKGTVITAQLPLSA